jgi:hypothetical protein
MAIEFQQDMASVHFRPSASPRVEYKQRREEHRHNAPVECEPVRKSVGKGRMNAVSAEVATATTAITISIARMLNRTSVASVGSADLELFDMANFRRRLVSSRALIVDFRF